MTVVPSHGRCRISPILSEDMSEGSLYDKKVRRPFLPQAVRT